MNFPLQSNDIMIFQASDAIVNTQREIRRLKEASQAAKSFDMKAYYARSIEFEKDKYFNDLAWFKQLAGHGDYMSYQ